jgi:hypothetical protein
VLEEIGFNARLNFSEVCFLYLRSIQGALHVFTTWVIHHAFPRISRNDNTAAINFRFNSRKSVDSVLLSVLRSGKSLMTETSRYVSHIDIIFFIRLGYLVMFNS